MRIIEFSAENIKRLKAVRITPTGNVVQITGPNGSGKSSVLDAILWALAGVKSADKEPIRHGETSATVRLDLGDVIVTRTFRDGKEPTLVVESAKGARFPSPQKMLDDLMGALSADPLAFMRLKPKEQREQLADLVGLSVKFAAIDLERADAFARRTEAGRDVKRLQGVLSAVAVTDETAQIIDVKDAMAALERAEAEHRAVAQYDQQVDRAIAALQAADDRVEALTAQLAQATAQREACDAALDALRDAPVTATTDVQALRQRILNAQQINADVAQRMHRDTVRAELTEAEQTVAALTAQIDAFDAQKRDLIAATPLPVAGLDFDEDGLRYGDVPLSQASSAEQLRVSTAIAMALNPTLRVIRIKDGSLLDSASMALLEEMAETHDFQVWTERVDTSGTVGIVMEDGTARVAREG